MAMDDDKGRTILVVDDDESSSTVIRKILEHHGFENVHAVSSGMDALEYLGIPLHGTDTVSNDQLRDVALVILDIVLTDLTGFDVCSQIKKNYYQTLPVLLITGFEISEYIAQGIEAGADDFLSKPIFPEELVARVNIMLQRGRQHKGNIERADSVVMLARGQVDNSKTEKIDQYFVLDTLSWSASSIIYSIRDEDSGEKYVLKRLLKQVLEFPDVIHRFEREIDIMKKLKHPNICRIQDDGVVDGCPYCVMEYLEGDSLESILNESIVLELDMISKIADGIARALKFLHESGIIHRDINLSNMYLCKNGIVKLSDFGVAIQIGDTRLTQHGYAIGTPIYMSPEQFEGENVTSRSDIYSFGAVIYHMLTGHPPFTADNVIQLMRRHQEEKPVSIEAVRRNIPEGWNELVVDRCLAKNPRERPESMGDVLAMLDKLRV